MFIWSGCSVLFYKVLEQHGHIYLVTLYLSREGLIFMMSSAFRGLQGVECPELQRKVNLSLKIPTSWTLSRKVYLS